MTRPGLDPEDALALLVATPGTKEEKQRFFVERYDVKPPRTNYDLMWDRLVEELGEDRAAEAVCSLVLSPADSRAVKLLQRVAQGRAVSLRLNEPLVVELLFDADNELTDAGGALVNRMPQVHLRSTTSTPPAPAPTATPSAPAQVRTHSPPSTEGADVILDWRRANPKTPDRAPWRWSACLYAYLHPATQRVLYIGKTDDLTVRQRFVSNFKRKFHELYARLQILKVDVIAADIDLAVSARLTHQWLDDLESLLIYRIQPPLNESKRKSRSASRPGTVVVCTGDWPGGGARFVDRG